MTTERQSAQDYFKLILLTVMGQALAAAGYTLEERPQQWAGGRFRFRAELSDGLYGFIQFQLLSYTDSEWSSGAPSRFRVTLIRRDQPAAHLPSAHPRATQRDLSALVVDDFGVAILPSAAHWWTFRNTDELGQALAETGHLIVGYGIPWLAGDLRPPSG
jgi:hypothetical protein